MPHQDTSPYEAPNLTNPIDSITENLGISETSGSFDFSKEQQKEERLVREDNRRFLPGRPESDQLGAIKESIYSSEASLRDKQNRNEMSAYYEKSTGTFNIGPGLNLSSELVRKSLKNQGLDADTLMGSYDFSTNERIDPELVPVMNNVFSDVVDSARKDARTYVGITTWNKLKSYERDALTEMSYNLGLAKLSKFSNTKKAIEALVNNRSPEAVTSVMDNMADSNWFNQVGNRAVKVIAMFANGTDEATTRLLKGLGYA